MSIPRFSHLRKGSLGTLTVNGADVPVRVMHVSDGNTATVQTTAARGGVEKGTAFTVTDNLFSQSLRSRTRSGTTLLVWRRADAFPPAA